jgi:hypothetical protein
VARPRGADSTTTNGVSSSCGTSVGASPASCNAAYWPSSASFSDLPTHAPCSPSKFLAPSAQLAALPPRARPAKHIILPCAAIGRPATLLDHQRPGLRRPSSIPQRRGSPIIVNPADGIRMRALADSARCAAVYQNCNGQASNKFGQLRRSGGRGLSSTQCSGGPDRIRTGGLVLDRDACSATTPRDQTQTRLYPAGLIPRQPRARRRAGLRPELPDAAPVLNLRASFRECRGCYRWSVATRR